jgi:hypothetical protein
MLGVLFTLLAVGLNRQLDEEPEELEKSIRNAQDPTRRE